METTLNDVTNTWTKLLLSTDTNYIVQIRGAFDMYIRFDNGTPTASEYGMKLKPSEGMTSGVHGTGNIWFKTGHAGETSVAAITK